MLTEGSLRAISRTLTQSCFLKVIPFSWNKKSFRLNAIRNHPGTLIIDWGITVYIWFYNIFLVISYANKSHSLSPTGHVLQIMWILCFLFGALFTYINITHSEQIALLFNNFFRAVQQLESKYQVGRVKGKLHICELMIQGLLVVAYGHCFLCSLIFFENPGGPRYYFSLIGTRKSPIWLLIVFWLIEFMTYLIIWYTALVNVMFMICYWFVTSSYLKEIRARNNVALVKGKELFLVYRTFQFLNQEFNSVYSKQVLPFIQLLFIVVPVTANFAVIRFHRLLSVPVVIELIILSVTCICFVIIAFPQAAAANTLSPSYLKWLKAQFPETVTKRQIRSCPHLKVHFGRFFFLQRFTPFKTTGLIIYWTMKSLLMFKNTG